MRKKPDRQVIACIRVSTDKQDLDKQRHLLLSHAQSQQLLVRGSVLASQDLVYVTASVRLDWTPMPYVEDGGGYEVSYATDEAAPFVGAGVTRDKTALALVVRHLTPATPYVFRVRRFTPAHDDQQNAVWSEWSEPMHVTTSAEPDATRTWLPVKATTRPETELQA